MEHPMLPLLERAELAAREHLQTARAEADRRRAVAHAEVARIEAASDSRAAEAADEVRRAVLERCSLEIAAVERALAELDEAAGHRQSGRSSRQLELAVERIVAAVLGEQEGQ